MSGTVPRRRRRSNSEGSEEKVKEVEELGWRSVWKEAKVMANERRWCSAFWSEAVSDSGLVVHRSKVHLGRGGGGGGAAGGDGGDEGGG